MCQASFRSVSGGVLFPQSLILRGNPCRNLWGKRQEPDKEGSSCSRTRIPTLAISLLFAFASVNLAAAHGQGPPFHLIGANQQYLTLGDSLAFGFQPNGDYTHGYVDDLFQILQQEGVKAVANMGCGGESSITFISGGCPSPIPPHFQYTGPQLTAAVNFLKANPGKVSIVDVFGAFGGAATPNPNICTYTWFTLLCPTSPQTSDIHPTNLGYSVIANTFATAIPPD